MNEGAGALVANARAQLSGQGLLGIVAFTRGDLTSKNPAALVPLLNTPGINILSTAQDCVFDPAWLNFADIPQIPKFPFVFSTFTDPLGQAPSNFLFLKVEANPRVDNVRLAGGTAGATLLILPKQADGSWLGLIDLTQPGVVLPVSGAVTMKSGSQYSVELVK